eukprot:543674_1
MMEIDRNEQTDNETQFECKSDAFEYVDTVSEHLICSICFNPLWPPKLLICGHTFCKECIESNINKNGRKCPLCNQTFKLGTIRDASYALKAILNELKVKCPNWKCCQIIQTRDKIENHFKTCWANNCNNCENHQIGKCLLEIIKCSNIGCNVNISRQQMNEYHINQCKFKRNINVSRPIENNYVNGGLTQEQREKIKRNKERALQRRAMHRLSQSSQSNNYSNNNNQLSENVKRRIEQNRQNALERRRKYQMNLSQQ